MYFLISIRLVKSVRIPAETTARAPKIDSLVSMRARIVNIIDTVPIFFVLRTAAVRTKVKSGVVNKVLEPGIGKSLDKRYKNFPRTYIRAIDIAINVMSLTPNLAIFMRMSEGMEGGY